MDDLGKTCPLNTDWLAKTRVILGRLGWYKFCFKRGRYNSLQYIFTWIGMHYACIFEWLRFNFWFTFGDFWSSNERRFNYAFGCYLFAILDFRSYKRPVCATKVSIPTNLWRSGLHRWTTSSASGGLFETKLRCGSHYIFILLRACSIIGSVCLVICETLQTGRSLFAGLPELHDKMNGFFFQFQLQKENTTSYNMNHMV